MEQSCGPLGPARELVTPPLPPAFAIWRHYNSESPNRSGTPPFFKRRKEPDSDDVWDVAMTACQLSFKIIKRKETRNYRQHAVRGSFQQDWRVKKFLRLPSRMIGKTEAFTRKKDKWQKRSIIIIKKKHCADVVTVEFRSGMCEKNNNK